MTQPKENTKKWRWNANDDGASYYRALNAWRVKVVLVGTLTLASGIALAWSFVTYGLF